MFLSSTNDNLAVVFFIIKLANFKDMLFVSIQETRSGVTDDCAFVFIGFSFRLILFLGSVIIFSLL
ncbi:hypothetical protein BIX66_00560 [Mycoplasmoides pneumoniae]|nr:hypothetical protein F535_00565 [Mycoplasmoides pneumoniae 85138]ALA35613.1 hypothetical protein F539_00555 [Mycoplasmoides pneumoniae FH]APL98453.1 hypothetical protein BIX66_00560 [Mycoplasmoides pneumoniae]ARQ34252.1 hypothetical protein BIX53_00560 [Mycoplasmoides pneumoniae]ARQ35673.1 hypothetical protein BIX64_00565 [Mycoplasmoides pneumoniae]